MAIGDQVPLMTARGIPTLADQHWGGKLQWTANAASPLTVTGLNTAIHNSKTHYFLNPLNGIAAKIYAWTSLTGENSVALTCSDNGTLTVAYNASTGETGVGIFHYVCFVGGKVLTAT